MYYIEWYRYKYASAQANSLTNIRYKCFKWECNQQNGDLLESNQWWCVTGECLSGVAIYLHFEILEWQSTYSCWQARWCVRDKNSKPQKYHPIISNLHGQTEQNKLNCKTPPMSLFLKLHTLPPLTIISCAEGKLPVLHTWLFLALPLGWSSGNIR